MNVLAIGAHPDDIEIGCGGALAAHRYRGDRVALLVLTRGEQGPQHTFPRTREQEAAAEVLGADLYWGPFEDTCVPYDRSLVDSIEAVAKVAGAETVYTHSPNDTHQDHRAVAMASVAAVRRCARVLLYESPTTTSFVPAVYVDVASHLDTKVAAIRAHVSQVLRNGLVDLEAVEAQARYRGFTARIKLAEGFETDRFVWEMSTTAASEYLQLEPQLEALGPRAWIPFDLEPTG